MDQTVSSEFVQEITLILWIPELIIVLITTHNFWVLFDRASSSWNKVECQLDATR